ncbi:uncharacterized protein LOC142353419 [Convolutriloba macropyga]|uniref:uncharacterized protein LOC142353419 n=1 Tax=Convolutriloba macropyga TaxID=536237 RepID=UPI003F51DF06
MQPSGSYFQSAADRRISTGFPKCSNILWDRRCVGTEIESSFSYFKDINLNLVERAVRLAYSSSSAFYRSSKSAVFKGLFLGSLSSHDSDDEIKIVINRFDPGIYVGGYNSNSTQWPQPSSKLPDDLVVPVLMVNRAAAEQSPQPTNKLIAQAVKDIEHYLSNAEGSLSIHNLFKTFCLCTYTDQFGELCFELNWNIIAPATSFNMKPVNYVPIIPTALARNLSGPLNLSALQSGAKHGYLTMDQTRKLLLLLESDPKVNTLPLVGVWISGVTSSCDVSVWASLARYQKSCALANKQNDGAHGFLALCYMTTERKPSFFECSEIESSSSYKVFQCQEELNLFKESNSKADSTFIYFPLSLVEMSPIHQVADLAVRTISSSTRLLDSKAPHFVQDFSSIAPCSPTTESLPPCPQSAPVPHSSFKHRISATESVPEVSVWEPQTSYQLNKSDSMEQDQGFFSKSSSDHDSSLERMVVYTRQHITKQPPLDPIESSTNVTERSSNHTSVQRNAHKSDINLDQRLEGQNDERRRKISAHSECASCKSDKNEMNSSLEQQRKQLELLQNQIQTLLKAQNIAIPEHINRTVATRSAQTSPAESTNVSVMMESSNGNLTAPFNNSSSVNSKAQASRDEETWASIDPNSVPLQEDNCSHDNLVISHVQMPSFVDSECDNATVESEEGTGDETEARISDIMNDTDIQQGEVQMVNCLNSVVMDHSDSQRDKPNRSLLSTKQEQIDKLNQQIANALIINSPSKPQEKRRTSLEPTHAVDNRTGNLHLLEPPREERTNDLSHTKENQIPPISVATQDSSFVLHSETKPFSANRVNIVDLSMAANAIAMKYQQSDTASSQKSAPWSVSSTSFLYEYNYLPHAAPVNHYGANSQNSMPNSDVFEERCTNLSFATEQYLAKHGILNGIQVSKTRNSDGYGSGVFGNVKSSLEAQHQHIRNGTRQQEDVDSNELVFNSRKPAGQISSSRATRPQNKQTISLSDEDDNTDSEDFNILDIEKLRSLPKLL